MEFVCIDTTRGPHDNLRFFEHDKQYGFLDDTFTPANEAAHVPWRIPFAHHPTYCAGPHHGNTDGMAHLLSPLFERAEVRLVLAGHEHNFQYSKANGVHYVVSGAGGELREEAPDRFDEAYTKAWASEGHFLIVELESERALVRPLTVSANAELRPVSLLTPERESFPTPIEIPR